MLHFEIILNHSGRTRKLFVKLGINRTIVDTALQRIARCGKEYRYLERLINFKNCLLHTKMFVETLTFKIYRLKKFFVLCVKRGIIQARNVKACQTCSNIFYFHVTELFTCFWPKKNESNMIESFIYIF